MRLVDQTVIEKRIPMRNPTSPAQKIDGPKRLANKAGIRYQVSSEGVGCQGLTGKDTVGGC